MSPRALGALGALLIGAGAACMVRAAQAWTALKPCEDCDDDVLATIDGIAGAGAEMNGTTPEPEVVDD